MMIEPFRTNAPTRLHHPRPPRPAGRRRDEDADRCRAARVPGLWAVNLLLCVLAALFLPGCASPPRTEFLAFYPAQFNREMKERPPYSSILGEIEAWIAELPGAEADRSAGSSRFLRHLEVAPDGSWFWSAAPQIDEAWHNRERTGASEASVAALMMLWRRDGERWVRVPLTTTMWPSASLSSGSLIVHSKGRVHRIVDGSLIDCGVPSGGRSSVSPDGYIVTARPVKDRGDDVYTIEVRRVLASGGVEKLLEMESSLTWSRALQPAITFAWAEGGRSVVVGARVRIDLSGSTAKATAWSGPVFRQSSTVPGGAMVTDDFRIVRLDADCRVSVIADIRTPTGDRQGLVSASPSGRWAVIQRPTWVPFGTDENAFWLVPVRDGMGFPTVSGTRVPYDQFTWVSIPTDGKGD